MRKRIKRLLPLFAMVALLFMAWLPADVMAKEAKTDIPVTGQINKETEAQTESETEVQLSKGSTITKTDDTSAPDLWLIVATASLLVTILMLLLRENCKTKRLKYSEVHF